MSEPDPDDGLNELQKRFKRAGMPTTCMGWLLLFVILTIAHAVTTALQR